MIEGRFFRALNITNKKELKDFSSVSKVKISNLRYYNEEGILPSGKDLESLLRTLGISKEELKLKLGIIDNEMLDALQFNSSDVMRLINKDLNEVKEQKGTHELSFETDFGKMFHGDCLSLMDEMESESVDLIFADPPFNLDKTYESGINDKVSKEEYLRWTEKWVSKCVDLLKEGGAIFIWNLPVWNTYISDILNRYLTFRHWIAVDVKYRLPIKNRLYPSHYGMLYYVKGKKPKTFNNQRLPLKICRHCGGDIHDYGGYKSKLNEDGINLTDVWYDIPPVRHSLYKTRDSNELSLKLLERVISLASNEGDTVFDPFGGSGTTYIVSEILKRNWIGVELGPVEGIKKRFEDIEFHVGQIKEIQKNSNTLFTDEMRKLRKANGHWLPETLNSNKAETKKAKTPVKLFDN